LLWHQERQKEPTGSFRRKLLTELPLVVSTRAGGVDPEKFGDFTVVPPPR